MDDKCSGTGFFIQFNDDTW